MIELPDDCLLHILSYIEEISELHCIASTCTTLSRGKPKDFIKNKFLQKIAFIEYNFNKSIIWLVGGLPQMVFYPILSIDFMSEFRYVVESPVKILPKHMKYPIMIGTHEGKAFVSFLIRHKIKDSIKELDNKCNNTTTHYKVITIYEKYDYFESSWYSTSNFLGNETNAIIAGYRKGYFELLNPKLNNNIYRIICGYPVYIHQESHTSNILNTYTIEGYVPKSGTPLTPTYP
jgi:hypothetical protein